mgnify:FL=1
MKKVLSKILGIILNILLIIAFLILIFGIYYNVQTKLLNKEYVNIFGYTFFEVATGSMSGSIEVGDVVLVKITNEVQENDIIVFKENNSFITHRIVKKDGNIITTKGDANNTEDNPITIDKVLGKVTYVIENIGIIRKVITSPAVLISITITLILLGIIVIYKPKEQKVEEDKW